MSVYHYHNSYIQPAVEVHTFTVTQQQAVKSYTKRLQYRTARKFPTRVRAAARTEGTSSATAKPRAACQAIKASTEQGMPRIPPNSPQKQDSRTLPPEQAAGRAAKRCVGQPLQCSPAPRAEPPESAERR